MLYIFINVLILFKLMVHDYFIQIFLLKLIDFRSYSFNQYNYEANHSFFCKKRKSEH